MSTATQSLQQDPITSESLVFSIKENWFMLMLFTLAFSIMTSVMVEQIKDARIPKELSILSFKLTEARIGTYGAEIPEGRINDANIAGLTKACEVTLEHDRNQVLLSVLGWVKQKVNPWVGLMEQTKQQCSTLIATSKTNAGLQKADIVRFGSILQSVIAKTLETY